MWKIWHVTVFFLHIFKCSFWLSHVYLRKPGGVCVISGLGSVCVSGYEWLLPGPATWGREMQSGESGALRWVWGKPLNCQSIFLFCDVGTRLTKSLDGLRAWRGTESHFIICLLSVWLQEWQQKCTHYFILTASRGSLTAQALLTHPPGSYHKTFLQDLWAILCLFDSLLLHGCMYFPYVCDCVYLFTSVSSVPRISPSQSPVALRAKTLPTEVCVEGLAMASTSLGPGQVLLSGGSSRGGRGAVTRLLLRGQAGWKCACVGSSEDWGEWVLCFWWIIFWY